MDILLLLNYSFILLDGQMFLDFDFSLLFFILRDNKYLTDISFICSLTNILKLFGFGFRTDLVIILIWLTVADSMR